MQRVLICLLVVISISGVQERSFASDIEATPLEEVVTTATKKAEAEAAQTVPAARNSFDHL